jgi:hypothetical protein
MAHDDEGDEDLEFLQELLTAHRPKRTSSSSAALPDPKVRKTIAHDDMTFPGHEAHSSRLRNQIQGACQNATVRFGNAAPVVVASQIEEMSPHECLPYISLPAFIGKSCLPPSKHSGAILAHCITETEKLREDMGGPLCVLKIGITHDVPNRWQYYTKSNFTAIRVIHTSMSLAQIEMLEAALISSFAAAMGSACRNTAKGGEGMRAKGKPRHPPPYFVYIVAARADQLARIGC